MPSHFVRAHLAADHPDSLGDLTLDELAALRLTSPGERPTPQQASVLTLRMWDQAAIGQLVLKERVTPQPSVWTGRHLTTVTIAPDDYYAATSERGTTKVVAYERWSGPPSNDPKEYRETPDHVEWVVTIQAARDLYAIDPENWSKAALRWCDADKKRSLQEDLVRLGVPLTVEEVEALKTDPCKKQDLKPEITMWLKNSGYDGRLSFQRIMEKRTKESFPWVKLADTGYGSSYRPLLKRLFEVMLPDDRHPGLHLINLAK